MTDRFEIISTQHTEFKNDENVRSYHNFMVFRDKLTGIMYLETDSGTTPLLNKDGTPMTAFKVNI